MKKCPARSCWSIASFIAPQLRQGPPTTKSPFAQEVIARIGAVYASRRASAAQGRRASGRSPGRDQTADGGAEGPAGSGEVRHLRQSSLIKAIDYMLERWNGLTVFLDDGRLEPDTNMVERPIRPIGIGKKNSLFSGDEGGGETWAILASLLNTANSMASTLRPISPTFSNEWSPARPRTTSFMSCSHGIGRLRARPKPAGEASPRHEQAEASPGKAPGAKAGQDRQWPTTPCPSSNSENG